MSKVAAYLQEHIQGEVSINPAIRAAFNHDAGILEINPEIIIYPRLTNDIRKVARFAWQLAEKGHILAITARGGGSDETGAAIGAGAIISTTAHMNRVLEIDAKQKLVRVQPGVNAQVLSDTLALRGLAIPALPASSAYSTIGGAIANNAASRVSAELGDMRAYAHQLEVVLASGDVLQTSRLSKRELSKKRGEQTFEGEIYRQIDDLIEDNKQLIAEKIADDIRDDVGYSAIAHVKAKDGSFDLTPLIVGSQGTLGVVSEMILRADFIRGHHGAAVICFASQETARDMLDTLHSLKPSSLEYFDSEYFDVASTRGRQYIFNQAEDSGDFKAVIIVGFDDFHEHAITRKLKKLDKLCSAEGITVVSATGNDTETLASIREVTHFVLYPQETDAASPPLIDGVHVPRARLEDFMAAVMELAKKYHVTLPLYGDALQGIYYTRPTLQFKKVTEKQKLMKLLDDYANLVASHSGHLIGRGGEGRAKAVQAWKQIDPEVAELFKAIKTAFDPYHILNPGVKEPGNTKQLISQLRPTYDLSEFASHAPYN